MGFNNDYSMMIFGFFKLFNIRIKGILVNDQEIKCYEGQNTTGMVYYTQTEPMIFLYRLNLVDYLTCKLNLLVVFKQDECDYIENLTQVCPTNIKLTMTQMLNTRYVPIRLEYQAEILSALTYNDDMSLFPFVKLFSNTIWIFFLASLITYVIILSKIESSTSGFIEILSLLIENFLNHSSKALSKLKKKNKYQDIVRSLTITLLFIWLICTTILSKSFTSLLLRTYSIRKPSLTVETLEEIVSKPDLFVAGFVALNELKPFKPHIYRALEDRVKKYHASLQIPSDEFKKLANDDLARDVIKGRAVIILHSFARNMIKLFYPNGRLLESDYKYNQMFRYSFVSKTAPHQDQIYRMLKASFESGITEWFYTTLSTFGEFGGATSDKGPDFVTEDMKAEDIKIDLGSSIRGPFLALFTGNILATLLFLFEKYKFLKK